MEQIFLALNTLIVDKLMNLMIAKTKYLFISN